MKKLLALFLALLTAFSVTACTIPADDDDSDALYTLRVGFYQGGLGSIYMDEVIKLYEAENPDVDVKLIPGKSEYTDGSLLSQISSNNIDLYVLDSNSYATFYQSGHLEDITTEVTTKIFDDDANYVESGATKSIEDTMWKEFSDFYKTADGKYYAIPNYCSVPGIIYDADLFEDEGYEVPETYPEFVELMDDMVTDGYTPFAFSTLDYITLGSMEPFVAMYEGKNNYDIRSTFSGKHTVLGDINMQNAYLLQTAEGKKAGVKFAYDLARNEDYVTQTTRNGMDNLAAQKQFVTSITQKPTSTNPSPRIAMFLEHSYWEREAAGTFDGMPSQYGFGKRNFKYMKAPKMIGVDGIADTTNTKDTVLVSGGAWSAVSAYSTQKDLAKDFLVFMQRRECMAKWVMYSGCLRPYDFKLTEDEIKVCTPYALSLYDLLTDDNVEFTTYFSNNEYTEKQSGEFAYDWRFYSRFTTTEGNGNAKVTSEGRQVFNLFLQWPRLTVQEYYDGFSAYWSKENWETRLSKI